MSNLQLLEVQPSPASTANGSQFTRNQPATVAGSPVARLGADGKIRKLPAKQAVDETPARCSSWGNSSPATRTGADGKTYPARKMPAKQAVDETPATVWPEPITAAAIKEAGYCCHTVAGNRGFSCRNGLKTLLPNCCHTVAKFIANGAFRCISLH